MNNPFNYQKPAVGPDFFGRKDIINHILDENPHHTWIIGSRRIGKTSLLHHLRYTVLNTASYASKFIPIYWNMHLVQNEFQLISRLIDGLYDSNHPEIVKQKFKKNLSINDIFMSLKNIVGSNFQLLLLCDEVESLALTSQQDSTILKNLGFFLSSFWIRTVIVSTGSLRKIIQDFPEQSLFWKNFSLQTKTIGRLDREDAIQLIRQDQNGIIPADWYDTICKVTNQMPFYMQLVCLYICHNNTTINQALETSYDEYDFNLILEDDRQGLTDLEQRILYAVSRDNSYGIESLKNQNNYKSSLANLKAISYVSEELGILSINNYYLRRWYSESNFSKKLIVLYDHHDQAIVQELVNKLRKNGLVPWFDRDELQPGDSLPQVLEHLIPESRQIIICFGKNTKNFYTDRLNWLVGTFRAAGGLVIPIMLPDFESDKPDTLSDIVWIDLPEEHSFMWTNLIKTINKNIIIPKNLQHNTISHHTKPDWDRFLLWVRLENIGLFEHLDISFMDQNAHARHWTVLVGENSQGKSTILRAIALATCGKDAFLQLLGTRPENMIKIGQDKAVIKAEILKPDNDTLKITIILDREWDAMKTLEENTPMLKKIDELIATNHYNVFGYGVSRRLSRQETGPGSDIPSPYAYPRAKAVATLFSSDQLLRSLQKTAIDLDYDHKRDNHFSFLVNAFTGLLPRAELKAIDGKRKDLLFSVDGNLLPLSVLSDGMQAMAAWWGDLLYNLYDRSQTNLKGADAVLQNAHGLLLIDEIDSHLHPQWQSDLLGYLTQKLPKMQIITTTHSPFILRSLPENSYEAVIAVPTGEPLSADFATWPMESILRVAFNVSPVWSQEFSFQIDEFRQALFNLDETTDINSIREQYASLANKSTYLKNVCDGMLVLLVSGELHQAIKQPIHKMTEI